MASSITPAARTRALLLELAATLEAVGGDEQGRSGWIIATVREYLVPRLANPARPLLVVIFGPTGSGKSTILNSLAGRTVSPSGVLRPTTDQVVIWAHHRHRSRYQMMPVETSLEPDDHPLLGHLTLVDTPDIDSYRHDHRDQAESMLRRADVGLYVTTPQRYADAVPWEVLASLHRRRTPLIVVANRLSRRASGSVRDLTGLLRDAAGETVRSLDEVVVIQEQHLGSEGRLPLPALERVEGRLRQLAADWEQARREAALGAIEAVLEEAEQLSLPEVEAIVRQIEIEVEDLIRV